MPTTYHCTHPKGFSAGSSIGYSLILAQITPPRTFPLSLSSLGVSIPPTLSLPPKRHLPSSFTPLLQYGHLETKSAQRHSSWRLAGPRLSIDRPPKSYLAETEEISPPIRDRYLSEETSGVHVASGDRCSIATRRYVRSAPLW